MKLKEYISVFAVQFSRFNKQELYNYCINVRENGDYHTFEHRILFDMFRIVNRNDNYRIYDEMNARYPTMTSTHILTMLKAAFKHAFGCDVNTFITRH